MNLVPKGVNLVRKATSPCRQKANPVPKEGQCRYTSAVKNVLLVILDGWGHSEFGPVPDPGNAVEQARVPRYRGMLDICPTTRLACSGLDVGLPEGLMGNSEVGHTNLGAGRIVSQDIVRIDRALEDGSLAGRIGLRELVNRVRGLDGRLHLIGLVSDAGVHSHVRHLTHLLRLLPTTLPLRVHAISDGRDASPTGSAEHVAAVERVLERFDDARVTTVGGRYWTMDRDQRWDRTERAWRTIVDGRGPSAPGPASALLRRSYASGVTDEFIEPVQLAGYEGITHRDAVFCFNFRADRMRQLVAALSERDFSAFERGRALPDRVVTMTEYSPELPATAVFPPVHVDDGLGEVISNAGLRQLRVAETEKYAHVTYFFNGGREEPFPGEDRDLEPSLKVATYDLSPEMSAREVAAAAVRGIEEDYAFVLVNFANPDVVGHTGSIPAAVRAVETVDECLGQLLDAVERMPNWVAVVTADHGNCERMLASDGSPHTAHTTEPVDLFVYDPRARAELLPRLSLDQHPEPHRLADVAPTVLGYLGLPKPAAMTGRDLVLRPTSAGRLAPSPPRVRRPLRESRIR